MLSYIENILNEFRPLFKRLATFKWFVICVIAIMLRSDQLGVTSVIRDLALAPECYEPLIHFFRSSAYSLDVLREQWYRCVLRNAPLTKCRDRIILVGDGVKQSKEGKRMPGVKKMTQESETCSKPHFIHGHMFGALGVIAATKAKLFCMPLKFNIQDGLRSAAAWQEGNETKKEDADKLSGIYDSHAKERILSAVKAIESFVLCATVSTGILQLISLNSRFSAKIADFRYLRTKSSKVPSEGTVMYYLRKSLFLLLSKSPDSFVTQFIREKQDGIFGQKQKVG